MRQLVPLLLLAGASPAAAWGDCAHRAERSATLDAATVQALQLRAGAGELEVLGEKGRTTIEAVGTACADSAQRLAAIRIDAALDGDRARLAAVLPESSGGWMSFQYASLSLVVRIPERLAVDAEDRSGDARFEGFAALEVADTSGDLRIARIAGAVGVSDSSGDVEIGGGAGPVIVRRDNSGDIEIDGVDGDVAVERDTSGDIAIRGIGGAVRIGADTSGDITIEDVAGDASIDSDGSGGITARRIGGAFTVRADGSGDISHAEVRGPVSLPPD